MKFYVASVLALIVIFIYLCISTFIINSETSQVKKQSEFFSDDTQEMFTVPGKETKNTVERFETNAFQINNHLNLMDAKRKTAIIMGHGRSGSTLTGTMFKAPSWMFHYEPLKLHDWPKRFENIFDKNNSTQCTRNDFTVRNKMRCPISDMIYLLDLLYCRNTDLPYHTLSMEVNGKHSSSVIADISLHKGSFRVKKNLKCRSGILGVAIKTIRINGYLSELYELSDLLGLKFDILVHLVRDPRSVLTSRQKVGWGMPISRSYDDTKLWAMDLCSKTMKDFNVGLKQDNYVLLRYEDLAAASLNNTSMIYERIGISMPYIVHKKMEKNDLEVKKLLGKGLDDVRKDEWADYAVKPKDLDVQLNKWKSELNPDEIQAVNEGCQEVIDIMYPDVEMES